MVYVCISGTKIPITPVGIIPLRERYYNGVFFVRKSGDRVDFLLKYVDSGGISRTGILTRTRHQENRIAHIDFDGVIIKHRHLVENYNRVAMLIEQEKNKSAIDSLP